MDLAATLERIGKGRTDLVFDLAASGYPPTLCDTDSTPLIRHCAYFGDVSAIRFLLSHGETLASLEDNFDLNGAAFHGHWRLCQFLLEQGADANFTDSETGETPLHSALCKTDRLVYDRVLEVLLASGADPNRATLPDRGTGAFMRDCRTKGETPLHRAAAFGTEQAIQMLLDAGARVDFLDMHGDTPLSWASWYVRPTPILRLLLYGEFRINPRNRDMRANLLGDP